MNRKKLCRLISVMSLTLLFFSSCTSVNKDKSLEFSSGIFEYQKFQSVLFDISPEDFMAKGFKYGDSCDVTYSNGRVYEDVPFYSGYFAPTNTPALVHYQGTKNIEMCNCSGDSLWEEAECKEGDTVTVRLRKRGKYLSTQKALSMVYSNDRKDFSSDETFANFREMKGGNLKEKMFYRGASPVNNEYNRANFAGKAIKDNNIKFVLNLADNEADIEEYKKDKGIESSYYMDLYDDGKVALLSLTSSYRTAKYGEDLVTGLNTMSQNEGPYYIHCTEGKDRTGFVCILIECIANCTYDEMEYDYMVTYYNYYGIAKTSNHKTYAAVERAKFQDMMLWLGNIESESDAKNVDWAECAKKYLVNAGMTEKEYAALKAAVLK